MNEEVDYILDRLAITCHWLSMAEKHFRNIREKNTTVFRRELPIEAPPEPEPEPEIRIDMELRERVRAAGGHDLNLALEKQLTTTDVSRNHGRLSMPNRYLRSKFLTDQETSETKRSDGMWVVVVDENLTEFRMRLKEWSMGKADVLNLNGEWNLVVSQNSLVAKQVIQLWSFRRGSSLCFALVKGQT